MLSAHFVRSLASLVIRLRESSDAERVRGSRQLGGNFLSSFCLFLNSKLDAYDGHVYKMVG